MTHPTPHHWLLAWTMITGILILFYPPLAYAIGEDFTLGTFSCAGGVATGQLSTLEASCPTTLSFDNVFSFLVCNMQQIATNVLGHMYCGLILNLTPAVWAMVTLAVLLFGIAFTVGLIASTGGEAVAFLLKVAFVVAFATEADLIIGVAYRLLMTGMTSGVSLVLSGMNVPGGTTGADAFTMLDGFLERIIDYAVGGSGSGLGEERCRNGLFAVVATMSMAFPLAAYFTLALIGKIFLSLFRAIFGYIYAIFGVTFLIVLSPIFVCFYLFKPTQTFFNKWLAYMVSMVLQIVLLFAFLTFVLSLPVSRMTEDITNIIMYNSQAAESDGFRMPWKYCTLCDFTVVDRDGGGPITASDPNYIERAQLQCTEYAAGSIGPNGEVTDDEGRRPISVTFAASPQVDGQLGALLTLLGNGILALIVLAIMVDRVLNMIPMLAQRLAGSLGASYAPQMGGGDGIVVAPGESLARDFGQGVRRTLQEAPAGGGITGTLEGVRSGITGMATGRYRGGALYTDDAAAQQQAGFDWRRWISNPSDFGK